jgi:hypothetical protein
MLGAIPPLRQYAFIAWFSVKEKRRCNFAFELYSSYAGFKPRQRHRLSSVTFSLLSSVVPNECTGPYLAGGQGRIIPFPFHFAVQNSMESNSRIMKSNAREAS